MENTLPPTDLAAFRQQLANMIAGDLGLDIDREDPSWPIGEPLGSRSDPTRRRRQPAGAADAEYQGTRTSAGNSSNLQNGAFLPLVPKSLDELGVRANDIEALILKFLINYGTATGEEIAQQIKLPRRLIEGLLRQLKEERLVVYKATASAGDYVYELTESGCERARRWTKHCTYFGATPVSLRDYVEGVHAQSVRKQTPKLEDLCRAFTDLLVDEDVLSQLGQAVNSGLGLFLYGAPGNGKTSIAERITRVFGQSIWIPRAISVVGEIIRLYDPNNHEALAAIPPDALGEDQRVDERWIRIRRPTIIAGGELTLDKLEIATNEATGVNEAPLQLKSNCGTLVIDDFGRQRVSPAELLNRWILPLEKRVDILSLRNGRNFEVPFDQLVIFSTNLEPRNLVDEAFLRRIPYKIDVHDPSEETFRQLFKRLAPEMGIEYRKDSVDYLIEKYYSSTGRGMRYCHPRDLLHQIHTFCTFHDKPVAMTTEAVDAAAKNYFATM